MTFKAAKYRCADCRKPYQDCQCAHYMSEAYKGTLADHKAFLNGQRGLKVNKTISRAVLGLAMALLAVGCASPRTPSTFVAPSVAPLKQAVSRVEQRVRGATDAAKKLADECKAKSDGWANAYTALTGELDAAYAGLASAQDMADTLQGQAYALATAASNVAAERDKAEARVTAVEQSRHGWVKRFWWAAGVATLLGVWTFRKPLLALGSL